MCFVVVIIILSTLYCIGHCVTSLYVMAFTSNLRHGHSDRGHGIELRVKGRTYARDLPDLPQDDYETQKGDMWELNLYHFFKIGGCIKVNDIQGIAIYQSSNDGWNIDSIVTFLVVNRYYWELSSVDLDVNRWIDGDSDYSHRRFPLTLVV